tara:strand:+ start:72 stop:926 length:855 start_codon:yes stop_codon:yes gene_type:complete
MGKPKQYVGETYSDPFSQGGMDWRWDHKKKDYVRSYGESPWASIRRSFDERREQLFNRRKTEDVVDKSGKAIKDLTVESVVGHSVSILDDDTNNIDLGATTLDGLFGNAEASYDDYISWDEIGDIDPASDTGQLLSEMKGSSFDAKSIGFNLSKLDFEPTYTKVITQLNDKSKGYLGEVKAPLEKNESIAQKELETKTPDWKTPEASDWIDDTKNSPAAKSGAFTEQERWETHQRHEDWKASRQPQKQTPDAPEIEVPETQSATQVIEGGLIDAQQDYMSRNYA